MKNQKGITLIALVVTIVILIILAGVSIGMLTGDNGTISNANKASDETKKGNYQETLELIGINLQQKAKNMSEEELIEQYEKEIKQDKLFKKAKEISRVDKRRPITIQVKTEEDWIYWVTEEEVLYRGFEAERGIYVSLNGNTLSFFDNEEDAYNNKDSEEHYYGNIREIHMAYNEQQPWRNMSEIEKVVIVDEIEPISMCNYFHTLKNLKEIENIEKINTSRVKSMYQLFCHCDSLDNLDLSTFDTSNVVDMGRMFNACKTLNNLNLSSFNTANVTNMVEMFDYCSNMIVLDISSFDTSNVKDMTRMFAYCKKINSILVGPKWKLAEKQVEIFAACGVREVTKNF